MSLEAHRAVLLVPRASPWDRDLAGFHWQNGYGAFSVSSSAASIVVAYIQRQEEHHRKRKFQAEFRTLLRRHKVAWDERYVWD
jgi:putative transposase